ncbi:hypothetical protein A2U01_0115604, partial [Trifolium medium]|nr:hypothetical protein [Trifolium medium]
QKRILQSATGMRLVQPPLCPAQGAEPETSARRAPMTISDFRNRDFKAYPTNS